MKRIILLAMVTAGAILSSFTVNAQTDEEMQPPKTPKWVSDKGYWVVESNKQTPKDALVHFYNNEHILVYKEEIRNQKLKLNRTKTLLRLKAALEEAVEGFEKGTWAHQNNLLTQHLRQ
jgi:hypothetical protein